MTNKALDFLRAARSPVYKSTSMFYTSMTVNISKSKPNLNVNRGSRLMVVLLKKVDRGEIIYSPFIHHHP